MVNLEEGVGICPSSPQCKTLQEGEIRLLTIESESTLALDHVKLADNPVYYAISYRWGDENEKDTVLVYVNKQKIRMSRDVYDLLRHMFQRYQRIRVWLDKICINQQDEDEKDKQVMSMGRIYRAALSVHAWLGEATEATNTIFDALLSFQEQKRYFSPYSNLDAAEELSDLRTQFDDICQQYTGHAREPSVEDDPNIQPEINWLRPVFSNPYWQRLWIVQELVLAQSIFVFCGDRFIDFDAIYGLSLDWGSFEQGFTVGRYQSMIPKGLAAMHAIHGHRHRTSCVHPCCINRLICQKSVTIEEAIAIYASNHECTNQRDKVYGLRALVSEWENIPVCYGKTIVEVFQDVAKIEYKDTSGWNQYRALDLSRSMGLEDSQTASAIDGLKIIRAKSFM